MRNIFLLFYLLSVVSLFAQKASPNKLEEYNEALNAYWYAVPTDSVVMLRDNSVNRFYSIVQLYGKVPEGDFSISVRGMANNKEFFRKTIKIVDYKDIDPAVEFSSAGDYFRISFPTGCEMKKPDAMEVEMMMKDGSVVSKYIPCVYHTISGRITDFDGRPFKAFFSVSPDDFFQSTSVWSDSDGYYSIELPERAYNTYYCDDQTYGVGSLEYWGWRMIVDRDEVRDIRVGNGEVYNLHAWSCNGGFDTYFLYFRPMVLPLALLSQEEYTSQHEMGGKDFRHMGIAPVLQEKDITVKLDGESLPIISLQPIYETGKVKDALISMNAYLIQVERPRSAKNKKLTFEVSYDTHVTVNGKQIRVNSMGNCQLYTNITGLSEAAY